MVECEICGANADRKAEIEGAVLNVCGNCSKFGKSIVERQQRAAKDLSLPDGMQFALIENFSEAVRQARMKKRLSQEQLASGIKEKMSLIKRMEEGWNPPIETAKKLEKFFGINLLEKVMKSSGKYGIEKDGITIGDIAFVKKRK